MCKLFRYVDPMTQKWNIVNREILVLKPNKMRWRKMASKTQHDLDVVWLFILLRVCLHFNLLSASFYLMGRLKAIWRETRMATVRSVCTRDVDSEKEREKEGNCHRREISLLPPTLTLLLARGCISRCDANVHRTFNNRRRIDSRQKDPASAARRGEAI